MLGESNLDPLALCVKRYVTILISMCACEHGRTYLPSIEGTLSILVVSLERPHTVQLVTLYHVVRLSLKDAVFWDVTQYTPVKIYRRFGG